MFKHVNSMVLEHILSQLDYFRMHTSHLATQELGVKNGMFEGKGKARAPPQPIPLKKILKKTP